MTIETKTGPLCIIQVYAPDTSYTDTEMELFYDELQSKINQLPPNHKYIILGDMNAKVGRDSYSNWPSVVGIYGVGRCNERGERLLQFCAINNLTIVNTLYKHNLSRRITWTSPDGKTQNQIDYMIIQQNQKWIVKNCRVYNSADVGSDHSLLLSKIVLSTKKIKKLTPPQKKFDVDRLKENEFAKEFEVKIGGRFEPILSLLDTDIDELYNKFKNATNEVTKEVAGYRRRKKVEDMSQELEELCQKRREARLELLQQPSSNTLKEKYKKLNKNVKKGVKKQKKEQLEKKIKQLEEDFRMNDSHNLFKTVRELEGKPKKSLAVVKDSNGKKHTLLSEVLTLWKDHFEKHLNTSFTHEISALEDLTDHPDPDETGGEISKDDIKAAIRRMKTRKSPGIDNLTTEVIKAGGNTMVDMLYKIYGVVWKEEKTPKDFSKMVISPIHKKGDKLTRENYRAISLLSIPGKIFLRVLLNRMRNRVDTVFKETQYGFRPGRGTVDAIFIVRQIIEKARERKIPLHFHFIDFKAAFDTIWRSALWKMLKSIGISIKIVNILQFMYNNTECTVMIDKHLTEWFRVEVGVRQGCILSPTLFNIFLEFVMDGISSLQSKLQLDHCLSTDVRYADDTTLIAHIFDKLKLSTKELENACRKWGLKVNPLKCKVMSQEMDDIQIDNETVAKVNHFVFLGSVVPNTSDDVKRRIALASSAFGRLKEKIWSRKDIPNRIKIRLYYALIVPIAIYASETWTLKVEDSRKLNVFENNCLRAMAGKCVRDRIKMEDIRKQLGAEVNILNLIKRRRLNWFGHVNRRGEDSYVYRAYKDNFPDKRPPGRPPKRWGDQIRADIGLPLLTAEKYAKDRNRWKSCVDKNCARIQPGLRN